MSIAARPFQPSNHLGLRQAVSLKWQHLRSCFPGPVPTRRAKEGARGSSRSTPSVFSALATKRTSNRPPTQHCPAQYILRRASHQQLNLQCTSRHADAPATPPPPPPGYNSRNRQRKRNRFKAPSSRAQTPIYGLVAQMVPRSRASQTHCRAPPIRRPSPANQPRSPIT